AFPFLFQLVVHPFLLAFLLVEFPAVLSFPASSVLVSLVAPLVFVPASPSVSLPALVFVRAARFADLTVRPASVVYYLVLLLFVREYQGVVTNLQISVSFVVTVELIPD